jgi:hypothetical protein
MILESPKKREFKISPEIIPLQGVTLYEKEQSQTERERGCGKKTEKGEEYE